MPDKNGYIEDQPAGCQHFSCGAAPGCCHTSMCPGPPLTEDELKELDRCSCGEDGHDYNNHHCIRYRY